jgi:serine/threonine-protein kinase
MMPGVTTPDRIGRYRVLGVLGRGAMGVVYRGVDETLDRPVAVKVMSAGAGADADSRARFKREAQAAARLQHPNIVTIYELGEHEGAPFMALELLEGVDLQHAIEAGLRPDPKVTLPVVLQLLAGLGHAHDNGIVHRDVKPSNLFLPRGRPAKIMDFGVARLGQAMTSTGLVVGTPNYMSPEQVQAAALDGRSDLFSAGLILYELVTGEKAYRGDSVVALLYKIAHEHPDLSLIPRGAAWDRLRGVLERSLAKSRDDRYATAAAMAAELSQALLDLGGSAQWAAASDLGLLVKNRVPAGPSPGRPPTAAPPTVPASPSPPPEAPDATREAPPAAGPWASTTRLAAVLSGLAALILAGALVQLMRTRSAVPSVPNPSAAPSVPPSGPPETRATPVSPPPTTQAASKAPTPAPTATPVGRRAAATAATTGSPAPAGAARVERADALLAARRYAQALAEARAVLEREPGQPEAKTIAEEAEAALLVEEAIAKATEALAAGDKEAAMRELRRGLAVNSNEARLMALWREATQ